MNCPSEDAALEERDEWNEWNDDILALLGTEKEEELGRSLISPSVQSLLHSLRISTCKIPTEVLSRCFRLFQKQLTKELGCLTSNQLQQPHENSKQEDEVEEEDSNANQAAFTPVVTLQAIQELLQRSQVAMDNALERIILRTHQQGDVQQRESISSSVETIRQLEEYLFLDYMMQGQSFRTVAMYLEESKTSFTKKGEGMIDQDIYMEIMRIQNTLTHDHRCDEALTWCTQNGSKLRRIESALEFELHLQQFIELVRKEARMDAMTYARVYLSPFAAQHASEIQLAMATLAFDHPQVSCSSMSDCFELFSVERWKYLGDLFMKTNQTILGIAHPSLLCQVLQAGLSVLKTRACRSVEPSHAHHANHPTTLLCPNCHALGSDLSKHLPYAHQARSRLVCRIDEKLMDGDNPPMVLPNGYVYGKDALDRMARQSHDETITCPRTGETFFRKDAQRAFII